jgi:hypothetical protein
MPPLFWLVFGCAAATEVSGRNYNATHVVAAATTFGDCAFDGCQSASSGGGAPFLGNGSVSLGIAHSRLSKVLQRLPFSDFIALTELCLGAFHDANIMWVRFSFPRKTSAMSWFFSQSISI